MKRLLLLACLALTYTSTASAAPSLRCQGRLITVGVPAGYVLTQCGDPANQVIQEGLARAGTSTGTRLLGVSMSEHWIYDRGWGRFPAVLIFQDGMLKRIELLPYRSNQSTQRR